MGDAEGFGEGAGVEASGAAEGDQGEVSGIAAPFDGDDADGFLHGGVHDADSTGGELIERETASLLLEKFRGEAAGAVEIEREISTKKTRGLQAAKEEIGVGDGGLRAASVADGARIGPG